MAGILALDLGALRTVGWVPILILTLALVAGVVVGYVAGGRSS